MVFLLLRRGALANGGGAVPYAKKSPLQEALMYARWGFKEGEGGGGCKEALMYARWEARGGTAGAAGLGSEQARREGRGAACLKQWASEVGTAGGHTGAVRKPGNLPFSCC